MIFEQYAEAANSMQPLDLKILYHMLRKEK